MTLVSDRGGARMSLPLTVLPTPKFSIQGSLHNSVPFQATDSKICPKHHGTETKKLSSMLSEFIAVNTTQCYKLKC